MATITEVCTILAPEGDSKYAMANATGAAVRLACRQNILTKSTAGVAPTYIQANLIVLPSRYASDFRNLCYRNPVPCPLIAESSASGDFTNLKSYLRSISDDHLASNLDLRTDCPRYNTYTDSVLSSTHVADILLHWTPDHVAFVIGCSQSFESALLRAGLSVRHITHKRTVPMYRTNIPLNPAGVFTDATYVVSMRPFPRAQIEKVREVTRAYGSMHGEPIAWGWDAVAQLGIESVDVVQWGDAPLTEEGRPLGEMFEDEENVPVFWGCGVTPQEAVMRAGLQGTVMAHAPGHMLLLDCREDDIL